MLPTIMRLNFSYTEDYISNKKHNSDFIIICYDFLKWPQENAFCYV